MRGLLRGQRTKAWTWKTKRSERWLDSVLPRVSTHSRLLKTQSCYKAIVHPPYFPRSRSGLETKDRRKGIKRSGTFATDMVMNKTCHSCLFAAILNFKQSDSPPASFPDVSLFLEGQKRALFTSRMCVLYPSYGNRSESLRQLGAGLERPGRHDIIFAGVFLFFFSFLILRVGEFSILRELIFAIVIDWFPSRSLLRRGSNRLGGLLFKKDGPGGCKRYQDPTLWAWLKRYQF